MLSPAGPIARRGHGVAPGQYLYRYDPEYANGAGDAVTTDDPTKAARFANAGDAFECWRSVPRSLPQRPDGKPNRPLTAFTIEVVEYDRAVAGDVLPIAAPRGL